MRAVLLLALAALLVVPAASAQGPTPQPCGPLTLGKIGGPSAPLTPGGEGDVTVPVTNTNPVSTLTVTLSMATSTPGWEVKTGQQSIASLQAGATQAVTFHVAATKDAKLDAALSISATGQCTAGGLACPSTQPQCVTAASATGAVALQQAGGLGFPGLDGLDFPIEYLIAGVVVVALAVAIPLLIRKRRPALAADCPEPLKMVRPGRGTSFPIDLRNPGAEPLTAQFEVGPVPEGWSAFMPLPEVQLAPKEARSLWLMVRSPATATTGTTADVEVRLRNGAKPDPLAIVKVRAEVNPDAAEGPQKVG